MSVQRSDAANAPAAAAQTTAAEHIRRAASPIDRPENADLGALLERIGDARVVLIGEATHGSSEFYRLRARITQALIEHKGFDAVAGGGVGLVAARRDNSARGLD